VAYRETIRKTVKQEGKFVRQSGGKGQFGHVWLEISPQEPGKGYEFENAIVGGVVPKEYIPAVDKGIQEAMANGILAGYPVVDVKVKLFDGSYHEVDSSEMAFKIAASMGFRSDERLEISPQEPGKGYEFENAIVGGVVPKEYIPAVDKGIQEAMANGILAGYPVVDVKVKLFDGSYHEVDSSEMAFKIAASMGF